MSSDDFFIAEEDDQKYKDVCDIRKKADRTNTDVLEAFSGLECSGKELHNWESHYKKYKDHFKKGKLCLQRRLTTMKKFPARTKNDKTSRRKHIYPIQVAYAYTKDCLKKIGSKRQQDLFTKSVDSLISEIGKTQKNIETYFPSSIENSIHSMKNDSIKQILNRDYYDNEQQSIINKIRNIGYDKVNDLNREKYISILNEGFTKNIKQENEFLKENNINQNKANNERANIKTIKRNLRKRRETRRKPVHTPLNSSNTLKSVNVATLNRLIKSNDFKITMNERNTELAKRINELSRLYSDMLLLDRRVNLIDKMYIETFKKLDSLNYDVIEKLSILNGQPITKKSMRSAKLNDKYIGRIESVLERQKLGNTFLHLHQKLKERADLIEKDLIAKSYSNNEGDNAILTKFMKDHLVAYTMNRVNRILSSISVSERNKYQSEYDELISSEESVKKINENILEIETTLNKNKQQQQVLNKMIDNPAFASRVNVIETSKAKLKTLKEEESQLEKKYLQSYRAKTSAIKDLLQELNKKYYNPFQLKEILEAVTEKRAIKNAK